MVGASVGFIVGSIVGKSVGNCVSSMGISLWILRTNIARYTHNSVSNVVKDVQVTKDKRQQIV